MGLSTIGATGQGLLPPQALYPTNAFVPGTAATANRIGLGPGMDFYVPPGTWGVSPGQYSQFQLLDPVSQTWAPVATDGMGMPFFSVNTDGQNYRLINPTGFPVGAVITNAGSGYTSAPTVAASIGGSTWQALVGGGIGAVNINTASSGSGYAVPPLVAIAAPPSPGIQATAITTISGGIVTNIIITNPGAGYTSAPSVVLFPQNSDQNWFPASGVTPPATKQALATAVTSYVGQVTGILLTNEGNNPLSVAPAMTFSGGGGSAAAATVVMALTMTGYTITTATSGYATGVTIPISTAGGSLATLTSGIPAATNNAYMSYGMFVPRMATAVAISSGGTISTVAINSGIIDGGLFQTTPTVYAGYVGLAATQPVLAAVMGSAPDVVTVQPL